jgi:hypothetical protein
MFGLLAATGSGLLLSTPTASGFFNFFQFLSVAPPGTLDAHDIPEEWVSRLGSRLPAYVHYLSSLRLRQVTVRQLIAPHTRTRGSVKNTLPPKPLWRNIRETAKVVDALSRRLDFKPRDVISVYRSPAYNARCAGARRGSYHVKNNAIDIKYPCSPGKVTAMAREMVKAGIFQGGVGGYSTFTHVDTRGRAVNWGR